MTLRNEKLEIVQPPRTAPKEWREVLASEANGYWFSTRTLYFFSSRILWQTLTPIAGDNYLFISSEQAPYQARAYTVREWSPTGGVWTLGDFNKYETREQALKALRVAVAEELAVVGGN